MVEGAGTTTAIQKGLRIKDVGSILIGKASQRNVLEGISPFGVLVSVEQSLHQLAEQLLKFHRKAVQLWLVESGALNALSQMTQDHTSREGILACQGDASPEESIKFPRFIQGHRVQDAIGVSEHQRMSQIMVLA